MTRITLIAKASGVSAKSGKAWFRVTLRAKSEGKSTVRDYFVSESCWKALVDDGISEDDEVVITASLDSNLYFKIDLIEKAGY